MTYKKHLIQLITTFCLKNTQHYGIRETFHHWFKYYLENSKQFLSISGTESELASVNYGRPQGSVLGPLLFLIFQTKKCCNFYPNYF